MTDKKAKIVIERSYHAKLEDVWDLWTTKAGFESWWGPVGFRADVEELDARVGGRLRYDMVADTPEMVAAMKEMGQAPSHGVTSHFKECKPRERLVLTNIIDFVPGVAPFDNDIEVDFRAVGGRVTMVVTLQPMHSEHMSKMQFDGFTSQLTKLDQRFA
jgi:uncharacterized protein YndB with AHSA1/START domain